MVKSYRSFIVSKNIKEVHGLEEAIKDIEENYKFSDVIQKLGLTPPFVSDDFREALSREVKAYSEAEKYFFDSVANKDFQYGHGSKSEGKVDLYKEYFDERKAMQDDGHVTFYQNYLMDRAQIESDCTLSNKERDARIVDLERKNKNLINRQNKFESNEKKARYLHDFFTVLNRMPQKSQNNLLNFYRQCCDKGMEDKFNQTMSEYLVDTHRYPSQENGKEVKNSHNFSLDDNNQIRHAIFNLGGSNLDICIIDNKVGFINSENTLTHSQINALASYCRYNGISIPDYNQFSDMKVVDNNGKISQVTNEDGKSRDETVAEVLKEVMSPANNDLEVSENADIEYTDQLNNNSNDNSPAGNADDIFTSRNPLLKEAKLKDYDKNKMLEACKAPLQMSGAQGDKMKVDKGINSVTITVYKDEADRWEGDAKVAKNGYIKDNRAYSIRITYSKPPKINFCAGGKFDKFTADHAKAMLKAAQEAGCKYFTMPPLNENGIGKSVMEAYLKASVSTGVVPLLKGSKDGKGIMIGESDIANILKFVNEDEGVKDNLPVKHEYLIRLAEQVDKLNKGCGKNLPVNKIKNIVKFESVKECEKDIKDFFRQGVEGGWDKAQEIAAYQALSKIMKDIHKNGMLDGKPFNPLDYGNNAKLITAALQKEMNANSKQVKKQIDQKYQRFISSSRDYNESEKDRCYKDIYKEELGNALNDIKEILEDVKSETGVGMEFGRMNKVSSLLERPDIGNRQGLSRDITTQDTPSVGKLGSPIPNKPQRSI